MHTLQSLACEEAYSKRIHSVWCAAQNKSTAAEKARNQIRWIAFGRLVEFENLKTQKMSVQQTWPYFIAQSVPNTAAC